MTIITCKHKLTSPTLTPSSIKIISSSYAVFYKGEAINLRSLNSLVNFPGPKYKKCSFSNPGHAINLAERLNDLFKCEDFEVYKITRGDKLDF